MFDQEEPIQLEDFRRLRANRPRRSFVDQRPNEGRPDGSRLELAIAMGVDQRRWHDWARLDEDGSLRRP